MVNKLDDYMPSSPFDSLPRMNQDAVSITRNLGSQILVG